MIEEAGLLIMRVREPRPTADAVAQQPALEDATRLPYVLALQARLRRSATTRSAERMQIVSPERHDVAANQLGGNVDKQ